MNYVKHFVINGVDTKQVGCIELQGVPNAATEGAVGLLGMDMTSPTHEVYRCVAVNGAIYTWELLSAGMSILSAKTTEGNGVDLADFLYEDLWLPSNYRIKVGDLIIDSEGYLYQIDSLGSTSCVAKFCGTSLGGDYLRVGGKIPEGNFLTIDPKTNKIVDSGESVNSFKGYLPTAGDNIEISEDNEISVPIASDSQAGVVKVGDGLSRTEDGTISVNKSDFRGNGTGFSYLWREMNTDADDLKSGGHYFMIYGLNLPPNSSHGFLDVDYFDGTYFQPSGIGYEYVIRQTFTDCYTAVTHRRTYRYSPPPTGTGTYVWTEWTK